MTFNIKNFSPTGGQSARGSAPQSFQYKTNDSKSTVLTSGYFNDAKTVLEVDDLITVVYSSGITNYKVISLPLQGSIEIEKAELPNSIEVRSQEDFGNLQNIASGTYIINNDVILAEGMVLDGVNVKITSVSTFAARLLLSGSSQTLFTLTNGATLEINDQLLVNLGTSSTIYDTDNGSLVFQSSSQVFNFETIGVLRGTYIGIDVEIFNYVNGWIFDKRSDNQDINNDHRLDNVFHRPLTTAPTGVTMDFRDPNIKNILIFGGGQTPSSSETVFNFDKDLLSEDVNVTIQNYNLASDPSAVFAANSLDQTSINNFVSSSLRLPSSTALAKLSYKGNATATTISASSTDTSINTTVLYDINDLTERFLAQDTITFDNSTNNLTANFNHQMSDGDKITLTPSEYAGVLPSELDGDTEYFVISVSGPDFKVSLTEGGSEVNFTDNGSGTNYFRHSTGVSELGEVIYVGNEPIKYSTNGHLAISSIAGALVDVLGSMVKIATDNTRSTIEDGQKITVNNALLDNSALVNVAELNTNEGLVINVRNETNTDDLVIEDYLITLRRI